MLNQKKVNDSNVDIITFESNLRETDFNLYQEYLGMSKGEREAVFTIVTELMDNGTSKSLSDLWQEDYIYAPPTPEEFLTNDYFMGEAGKSLYPKWREELLYVLDQKNSIKEWIICLAGNTVIPLVGGGLLTIKEMHERWRSGGEVFWVYSIDQKTGKVVPGKCTAVVDSPKDQLYSVVLDDGTSFRGNANHKMIMSNGTEKKITELMPGDLLMEFTAPDHSSINTPADDSSDYEFKVSGSLAKLNIVIADAENQMHPKRKITPPKKGRVVVNVVKDELEEVYCLHVPGRGNFAILTDSEKCSGVFSKNTGAIGAGKSFAACFAQAYKLCCLGCLRDPQKFYGLAPGTSIVFSVFNLTIEKTEITLYNDLKQLLNSSPFFREAFPLRTVYGSRGTEREVVLPRGIFLISGSKAVHAMSTNVFSCILDEMNFRDSKKSITSGEKREAFSLYSNIVRRITSRFVTTPGILVLISSRQSITDFLEEHIEKSRSSKHVHISDFPLWETLPKTKFPVYTKTKKTFGIVVGNSGNNRNSKIIYEDTKVEEEGAVVRMGIPIDLLESAQLDPNGFARDVAGVATFPSLPLIPDRNKIYECIDKERFHPFKSETIVINYKGSDTIQDALKPSMIIWDTGEKGLRPINHPNKPRVVSVDLSLNGDSTGIAMGCPIEVKVVRAVVRNPVTGEREVKWMPRWEIFYDFFLEINPPSTGMGEIDLEKIQNFIVYLRNTLHFKIVKVSFDGFQSAHMKQNLWKRGFDAIRISVDRDDTGYIELRQAIMENRASYYEDQPFLEVEYLQHFRYANKKGKVDHLKGRKKDVCDAAAHVALICSQFKHPMVIRPIKGKSSVIQSVDTNNDVRYESKEQFLYADYSKESSHNRKQRKIINISR